MLLFRLLSAGKAGSSDSHVSDRFSLSAAVNENETREMVSARWHDVGEPHSNSDDEVNSFILSQLTSPWSALC